MKKEKVVIFFIAVVIGLIFAGVAFYFYQSTKVIPAAKQAAAATPTPTPKPTIYLSITEPTDEEVTDKNIIALSGQTITDGTIIVLTKSAQQVIQPTLTGTFSTTVNLDDGENLIKVIVIGSDGQVEETDRTVTLSTEAF